MVLRTILADNSSGADLEIIDSIFGYRTLAVIDHYVGDTRFKSETRVVAGTTTVTSPAHDGALLLTDIIISSDRVAGSRITVFFDDGTRQINIYDGYANDAPINFAANFHGGWTGWKNAALKITTVNAIKATISVGYIKIPNGIEYDEWDTLR